MINGDGANLSLGGGECSITQPRLLGPTKCKSLTDGIHNMSFLLDLMGCNWGWCNWGEVVPQITMKHLESDPEADWQLMKLMEERCHMCSSRSTLNFPGSCILHQMNLLYTFQGQPCVQCIIVVQYGGD